MEEMEAKKLLMTNEQIIYFLTNPTAGKKKACQEAIEWIGGRDLATAWQECHRGDWMLFFLDYAKCEIRLLTACKAAAAEVARPYMSAPQTIATLDAAHDFGRGEISGEELNNYAASYAAAAYYAYYAASYASYGANAAYYAANAAYYAASYASYAANAAYYAADAASYAANAAYYAADAAKKAALAKAADNIRAVLPDVTPLISG